MYKENDFVHTINAAFSFQQGERVSERRFNAWVKEHLANIGMSTVRLTPSTGYDVNIIKAFINRVLRQPCTVAHRPILSFMNLTQPEELLMFRAIIVAPNNDHWMTWKRNSTTEGWCMMDSEVLPTKKLYSLSQVWNALKKAVSAVFIP